MTLLESIFLAIFYLIYPYIHNHLVSYSLIVLLTSALAYGNWKWIRRSGNSKVLRFLLVFFEVFILAFLSWFVFIYFHTFQTMH